MIHLVFVRDLESLHVWDARGLRFDLRASGDAWGNGGPNAPYGHDCSIAPGHYLLTQVEPLSPALPSEGAGQIYVADLDAARLERLTGGGRPHAQGCASIGGVSLPTGGLARYDRSEVMIHGGGSNAPDPLAYEQVLCKTYGCTRVYNRDLTVLMNYLQPLLASNTVVFSVIGQPKPLPL